MLVLHKCGHYQERIITGSKAARIRQSEFYEKTRNCDKCFKKWCKQNNDYLREKYDLPKLAGPNDPAADRQRIIILHDLEKSKLTSPEIKQKIINHLQNEKNPDYWRNMTLKKISAEIIFYPALFK